MQTNLSRHPGAEVSPKAGMNTLYLCSVGNAEGIRLALTVNRAQGRWQRIVLLDDDASKHGTFRLGLEVVGSFGVLGQADPASSEVVNLVTRTTEGRAKARAKISAYGIPFASLIHPNVDLFGAEVAAEVCLYQNASIGAEAHVGESSVVLIGGIVGHGSRVGRYCVIAPNAVINARVRVGDRAYIGSNASILPDVCIGEGATIAANSVVFSDVPPGATAIGVPASIVPIPGPGTQSDAQAGAPPPAPANEGCSTDIAELETAIAGVLREILGLREVPLTGNFFELGGNSMKALLAWRKIQVDLGKELRLLDIYRFPTARALAAFLSGNAGSGALMLKARQRAMQRRQTRLDQTRRL